MALSKTPEMMEEIKKFIKGFRLSTHFQNILHYFNIIATAELRIAKKHFDEIPTYYGKYSDEDFLEFMLSEAEQRAVFIGEEENEDLTFGMSNTEEWHELIKCLSNHIIEKKITDLAKESYYLTHVKIPCKQFSGIGIKKASTEDGALFQTGRYFVEDNYMIIPEYQKINGFVEYNYPIFTVKDGHPFSLSPNSISFFNTELEKIHGDTLCLGGLFGYFPVELSIRDDIGEITVLEESDIHKAYFDKCLRKPIDKAIGKRKKCHWVYGDAFDFLCKINEVIDKKDNVDKNAFPYDTCFVGNYVKFSDFESMYPDYRKFFRRYPNVKVIYHSFMHFIYNSSAKEVGVCLMEYFLDKISAKERDDILSRNTKDIKQEVKSLKYDIMARQENYNKFQEGYHEFLMNKIKNEMDFKVPQDIKNFYTFETFEKLYNEYVDTLRD